MQKLKPNGMRLFVCLCAATLALFGQVPVNPSLHGIIRDPSGSLVPNAVIELRGPGGAQTQTTSVDGVYNFSPLTAGKYSLKITSVGFATTQKNGIDISKPSTLDLQIAIADEAQVLTVQDSVATVTVDPESNASALVLKKEELDALSDDPDELAQQLQALAGPGSGPNGGQIYIDGFTGGQLPPKASIREIRINSNPFSPEYDRPGFGRIEILTKPGSDKFRGQVFYQFNDQYFNSRNPLLAQSTRPPFSQKFYTASLTGPIQKNKSSFSLDFEHRDITEEAFILATQLDSNLNPQTINQAVVTPQSRTTITPRFDYAINPSNTLVMRYQWVRIGNDNQGVGDFSLPSASYNQVTAEQSFQMTETAVLNPTTINESRFQFMRSTTQDSGATNSPSISVQGAFNSGSATVGNSGNITNKYEFSNITTLTHTTHTFKWGGRTRESLNHDTADNNFNGTYTFFGGQVPGTSQALTALQVYQITLKGQQQGLTDAQIRAQGGGASLFAIGAGTPESTINQFDIGLFANDDWRLKPNVTLSYGLRYEAQTNIKDKGDISPRLALAWGLGGTANKPAKSVLRAGFGVFYDRVTDTYSLSADRFNGLTQQSYQIVNPTFFPAIPSLATLAAGKQPQNLQLLDSNIVAPRTYQANIGVDRQINKYARISANYITSRGVHLLRSRDINAPLNGIYPYGDTQPRFLTESTGFSRTNQLFISPNVNYKKLFLFGFYSLAYGKDDNEGQPANPYNVRAEWGPSTFADVRHRAIIGASVPAFWKVSLNPFMSFTSGTPFDITTGRNAFGDGVASARPSLMTGVSPSACNTSDLIYEAGYGCFNLNPAPGTPTIERNFGRGPATVMINMRISRTWSFGKPAEPNPNGMGGGMGGPGGGPRGGGGGPGGGGPPPGMFGGGGPSKYNLTLSINARNALNHANFTAPSGDLASPYFGENRNLSGGFGPPGAVAGVSSTYQRKIDLQLRFTF
jgi:Carboxypeptidase regulatory-like domain/TonB dependent receptor